MQKEQDSTVINVERASPDDEAYPRALRKLEESQVQQRRRAALGPDAPSPKETPPVGVAISGGGIRSATFALGVFHVLAREKLVRRIDFLSTVSGGGYFGAFLGRLFARDFVVPPKSANRKGEPTERPVDRVEDVLSAKDGSFRYTEIEERVEEESTKAGTKMGTDPSATMAARVDDVDPVTIPKRGPLDQLRDNGRYLAPRGGGDLLVAASVLFRNWFSLHAIIILSLVTLFLTPRIVEGIEPVRKELHSLAAGAAGFLRDDRCSSAEPTFAESLRRLFSSSPSHKCATLDLCLEGAMLTLVLAAAVTLLLLFPLMWGYWLLGGEGAKKGQAPRRINVLTTVPVLVFAIGGAIAVLAKEDTGWGRATIISGFVGLVALLAMIFALVAKLLAGRDTKTDQLRLGRAWISRNLVSGMTLACALLACAALGALGNWVWTCGGGFALKRLLVAAGGTATFAAFGKQIVVVFSSGQRNQRPGISLAVVAYVGAFLWAFVLLVTCDVLSRAAAGSATCFDAASTVPQDWIGKNFSWLRPAGAQLLGVILCVLLGRQGGFLNYSSHAAMYAQRLTRAYLGGSNPLRINRKVSLTDAIDSDDVRLDGYWRTDRGAPIHFINSTINETVDGATAVQFLDRKGLPIALGPNGLTAGKRHHYLTDWRLHFDEPARSHRPADDETATTAIAPKLNWNVIGTRGEYTVFEKGFDPEVLTIGQWVGISGAAFSTGIGAQTNLGMSLLCGLANVRLGYWFDSNLTRPRTSRKIRLLARLLTVQTYLASEFFARFPGTAWRRWYLTDGGHFENMGAYELLRRKLPLMVIVDGEADPDYAFEGLGNLVRLARVDYDADIRFLTEVELDRVIALKHRRAFGSLDHLRRGKWEDVEPSGEVECGRGGARLAEPDKSKHSLAHAALARVTYSDGRRGWLVYLKTTLTGREPTDVTHYHRVHEEFPHEPTSDQFFDEPQWESYRKLGEHVAEMVFGSGEDFDRVAPRDRPQGPKPEPKSEKGEPAKDVKEWSGWTPRDLFEGKVGPLEALEKKEG